MYVLNQLGSLNMVSYQDNFVQNIATDTQKTLFRKGIEILCIVGLNYKLVVDIIPK